jgi:hemolysin activation/secretion protein
MAELCNSGRLWRAQRVLLPMWMACCAAPSFGTESPAPTSPPVEASAEHTVEAHFNILEYRVLGNTVLSVQDVERAVYPHVGPGKTLKDVEAARSNLEQAYRASGRGTVYVDIPEQDVDQGIVRLKVTEGRLDRVRIQGARYFSGRRIRVALPSAQPGAVPDLPELQKEITAVNSLSPRDVSVVPVLAAGTRPGTVDLTLRVSDHVPFHGSVEVNDQHTADTSPLRLITSLTYDNLFDHLDNLSLQYQTAPRSRKELDVFLASYTRRLVGEQRLSFYFVNSNSDVTALGTLAVLGKGRVFGSRLMFPLPGTAQATHTLTLGADYKDFVENINVDPTSSLRTPIRYVNLSLAETSFWRMGSSEYSLSSTLNLGPRGLVNSVQEFADKRFRARSNYLYARAEGRAQWPLPGRLSLVTRLAGQYAVEPIISNEQFAIGGVDGARGYLEAEELGDIGYKASLQLQSPPLSAWADTLAINGFVFFDTARISVIAPLPDEAPNAVLRSWGVGVDFAATQHLSGALEWACPLVSAPRTRQGDSRLLFSVRSIW